ncbi:flavohemoglobin [Metarhizium album ARSEF 1941]|uniref:nitric oxide dioxygenase n=1 Tax=Metarhizium album (strain ARSEF 1941) TaxID=1081103 RepID=A0A0B2X3G4_METAS|nr:flavohemoglobin [Metarhizium album ARSEF 1941]KHN99850.1 flavohemoglobin [Metarhizium album ARSEF 1941]
MALTAQQIATVKSTVPIVRQYGKTITDTFYRNLLGAHPELKNYFSLKNQQSGAQSAALANAVFAYASHIDDLPKLSDAVERIAQKHASLFVKPDQYPVVGKYLLGAFAEVLGNALTPEIAEAWVAAYGQLADVFIQRERQLYSDAGEWQGWREFRVAAKRAETEHIISVYLEPVDGKPLPAFRPGQYVSVQIPLPELGGLLQNRQFSLSVAPEDKMKQYRVSVKKEAVEPYTRRDLSEGKVSGIVCNRLHDRYDVGDVVNVSPPRGEFFFDDAAVAPAAPVVLLSAGVGATPLVSILDWVLKSPNASRRVTWAHAARNSHSVCFSKHIRDVCESNRNVKSALFVKNIADVDEQGRHYDFAGSMDIDKLAEEGALYLDNKTTEYYTCGPEEWMIKMREALTSKGVAVGKVHLEVFRTGDV